MATPRSPRSERSCLRCGQIFLVGGRSGRPSRKYCSLSCSSLGNQNAKGHSHRHSAYTKALMSKSKKGNKHALGKGRPGGIPHTAEWRRMMSERFKGDNGPSYIDGKGRERAGKRNQLRQTVEYKLWREEVFSRDDYTCQICGIRAVELHADHVKPWSSHLDLRYEVANGRTLCALCHRKTDTYGNGQKGGGLRTI